MKRQPIFWLGGSEVALEPLQGISAAVPEKPPEKVASGAPFLPYDRFTIARPDRAANLPAEPFAVDVNVSPALSVRIR